MATKPKAKKGLGKGIQALFESESVSESISEENIEAQAVSGGVMKVKIRDIEPNPEQPRRNFDKDKLAELSNSIKEHGLIQPILVQKAENGMYIIIAGERRWRAAKLAGLTEVPCIEGEYSKREIMELALIENLQREDLNPIEESEGYARLMETFKLTQEEVAERVGKSRSAVANSLRLNNLCDEVKKMVVLGDISQGHARALLSVANSSDQILFAEKIKAENLNVRQTEKLVSEFLKDKPKKESKEQDENLAVYFRELESRLSNRLGTKVQIKSGKNKGKIEIEYYNNDELEAILDKIK